MKTLKLLALFGLFALVGCHDDDNDYVPYPTPPKAENIQGEWQLIHVSGGIAGINNDFMPGEIIWVFNEDDQSISVTNNNTNDNKVDFFDSGNYEYAVVANEATPELCAFNFAIDNTNLGCFNITENQFTMSMIEADGYTITLQRPQIIGF